METKLNLGGWCLYTEAEWAERLLTVIECGPGYYELVAPDARTGETRVVGWLGPKQAALA